MFKVIRRLAAALAVGLLAFKVVASFLSCIERQEDSTAEAWIHEDEFQDA